MWIITSSAWCLSLCPGGWNGTSWKRTWKQQQCSTWQQLCEPRRTLILGHEIHLHFQASCIFTCIIGEGVFCMGVLSQRCCWWQCSRNDFKAQLELFARCCLLPAPAGHSPGRMCSRSNGAQGTPETRNKMKNPTLAFVFTPWRSISTNRSLSNTKRRFAAAFILLPF